MVMNCPFETIMQKAIPSHKRHLRANICNQNLIKNVYQLSILETRLDDLFDINCSSSTV